MRERLAHLATVSAMILTLALSSSAMAQQQREGNAGGQAQNPAIGQDRNQQTTSGMDTIRGVVAAVTVQGEAMFDYRSNRAAAAEATFLTVVGSPAKSDALAGERTAATESQRTGSSGRRRHDIYYVWLTPQTKVCESSAESEKAAQSRAEKKEVALSQLEVGDHVEIQFTRREDSSGGASAHQTEAMRQKHGRHRTHVVSATSVTILSSDAESHSGTGVQGNARPGSR